MAVSNRIIRINILSPETHSTFTLRDGYTFMGGNSIKFVLLPEKGSTLKGKNLLLS